MNFIEHLNMTEEFDYDFAVRFNKADKKLYIYHRKITGKEVMEVAPDLVPVFIQWLVQEAKGLPKMLTEMAELSKSVGKYAAMLDNPMIIMMLQQMLAQRPPEAKDETDKGTAD